MRTDHVASLSRNQNQLGSWHGCLVRSVTDCHLVTHFERGEVRERVAVAKAGEAGANEVYSAHDIEFACVCVRAVVR